MVKHVPITETWERVDWSNWDTLTAQTTSASMGRTASGGLPSLNTQKHIDIRTFTPADAWTPIAGGTVGFSLTSSYSLGGFNGWPGTQIGTVAGNQTYTSTSTPIDLTAIGTNGSLVLALPSFSTSNVSLSSSIALSSDNFGNTSCVLPWSTSTTTPVNGNSVLTWPYSALTGVDLTAINAISITIVATGTTTVTLMALRLIGSNWQQTNVDFDSRDGLLRQTIPLNGDTTATSVPPNQIMPILWRSDSLPGETDPHPIDATMSFVFYTGSQTLTNACNVYMRGTEAFITQLDLQYTPMSQLSGIAQPTLGVSTKAAETIADLEQYTVGALDNRTIESLEERNVVTTASWMQFGVQWGPIPQIQVTNSLNSLGYTFGSGFSFANNTAYLAICSLEDTSAQVQIYNLDQTTYQVTSLLFDTGVIEDGYMFKRNAGRLGFQAILPSGNSWIGSLRPRSLMFGEFRSIPLNNYMPVRGAQLYVTTTPNIAMWTNWNAVADISGNAPQLSFDSSRTTTAQSTKVVITSVAHPQRVISNVLTPYDDDVTGIMDFNEIAIEFDIWFPGGGSLNAYLISAGGAQTPVSLPIIEPNQWQHIRLLPPFSALPMQAGLYQFAIDYTGSTGTTYWLDNVNIFERSMTWSARSLVSDPWKSNYAPWTDFREFLNNDTTGVYFEPYGFHLQYRGQARRQDVVVLKNPKIKPRLATLGRFVWPAERPNTGYSYSFSISPSHSGRAYTFTVSGSPPSKGNFEWDFGDGTFAGGRSVAHTYTAAGTYNVGLIVTDQLGVKTNVFDTITVT